MRVHLISAALVLALSGVALAATDTSGVIKAIDAKAMTVTLEDGTTYHLPAGFDFGAFKVGEKVTVSWDAKGGLNDALAMKAS